MVETAAQPDVEIIAEIVSAYVSNNPVPAAELPALIVSVAAALGGLASGAAAEAHEPQKPAVLIKKSVTPDYIISLEDGKKFKSLKRHLMSHYGMTPDEYRVKWNLPSDYPMVAPNYAAARSQLAKKMGLGRKLGEKPKSRGRKKTA
jgi:predicted transcriptional regulator